MSIFEDATPVIPAGGRMNDEFFAATGHYHRFDLPVGRETILERTLRCVREAGFTQRPIIVGPVPPGDYTVIEDQGGLWLNILTGLQAAKTQRIATITADMPLIQAQSLVAYYGAIDKAEIAVGRRYDFWYSIAPLKQCEGLMPDMRHTHMKFHEGSFTGGNVTVTSKRLLKVARLNKKMLDDRKSTKKLVRNLIIHVLVNPQNLVLTTLHAPAIARLIRSKGTHGISLAEAARLVSAITGRRMNIHYVAPDLACDIDDLEQWKLFQRLHGQY